MWTVDRITFNLLACCLITLSWWALDLIVWRVWGKDMTGGRT